MSIEITCLGESAGKWLFSDGSILPVVSGGSDGQGDFGDTGGAVEPSDDGQGSGQPDYSLGNNFLKDVPEEHRTILEPYIKKWDSGVTRRFQELNSKLKPYEGLDVSDPAELKQALEIYKILDSDPRRVYEALRAQFDSGDFEEDNNEDGNESFQGLPPELTQQLTEQQQVLEALAEYVLGQQQTTQEAQEDAELENYLELLKGEFGEFDEDYVLAKMYKGMNGENAVKAWQAAIQQQLNSAGSTRPAARVLSGGGVVPSEAQNVAKIPRKDIKNMVAQLMANAAQEG